MSRVRLLVLLLYFLTFEIFPLIHLLLSSVQCIIIIFARGESFAVMEGGGQVTVDKVNHRCGWISLVLHSGSYFFPCWCFRLAFLIPQQLSR